jgi:predicted Kef-type K+ transport protein
MNQAKKKKRHNSTYKKMAVQRLYEVLFFVSSSVLADSFVLRNRQLLLAANGWQQL